MGRISISVVAVLLTLFLCTFAFARDMQRLEENIPDDSEVKKIYLEANIDLARLQVYSHEGGGILSGDVRYDADKFDVDIEYEKSGGSADIQLFSEQRRRRLNLDTDENDWKVSLSRDYIWDIDLDIGFTECTIDLSGLPLERLGIDVGASECEIEFNRPNRESLKKLDIDAGAGEVRIHGLGYANFEEFKFDGGAGDFVFNFEGQKSGFRRARIDIGVGEVRLEIPKNLPVRIETGDSWLSSINIRGERLIEVDDDVYETKDFGDAEYGLEIDLDVGIGEADITWVR